MESSLSSHRFARDHMLGLQSRCCPDNKIMLLADLLSGTCHSHPRAMLLPVDGHYLPLHNKHRMSFQSDDAGHCRPREWWCLYSPPCHGMLCAAYHHPSQSAPVIYVWNPLTEQSRQLLWPVEHTEVDFEERTLLGFGYDLGRQMIIR
uniref:Uncharacterized protein n=1 Tax=Kalanchoe fedtschenkoi TaxID=63787 RepID=A0A7N0TZW6_KALFE